MVVIAGKWTTYPDPYNLSTSKVITGVMMVYTFFVGACISVYAWLAGGEIPSQRLRSYTVGLGTGGVFLMTVSASLLLLGQTECWYLDVMKKSRESRANHHLLSLGLVALLLHGTLLHGSGCAKLGSEIRLCLGCRVRTRRCMDVSLPA